MRGSHRQSIVVLLVVCCLFPLFFCARAGVPGELQKEIDETVAEKIKEELDLEDICAKLKIPYPPTPLQLAPDAIEKHIKEAQDNAVAKSMGPDKTAKYEEEARKAYPLYNIGDRVSLSTKKGQAVEGIWYRTTGPYYEIGSRKVAKIDLIPDSAARLDPELNQKAIDRYVYPRKLKDNTREQAIRDRVRETLEPRLYSANGYVKRKGKWVAQKELFEDAIVWYGQKLVSKHKPEITAAIMTEAGYVKGADGEWRKPPKEPPPDKPDQPPDEPEPEPEPGPDQPPDGPDKPAPGPDPDQPPDKLAEPTDAPKPEPEPQTAQAAKKPETTQPRRIQLFVEDDPVPEEEAPEPPEKQEKTPGLWFPLIRL